MLLKRVLRRAIHDFRLYILRDSFLRELRRWTRENADSTLRLNYPLNSNCTVWDVGGYKGDFAQAVYERFGCEVMVFEPMPSFFTILNKRFAGNAKIKLFPYGLADTSGVFEMYDLEDGSSFYRRTSQKKVEAKLRQVAQVIDETNGEIALIKINIEGGEYNLLPALIKHGIERFRFVQVQFHDFIPGAATMRDSIRATLSLTHREMWCYDFVWESWERKS
jgi:FkbM family methyltransferase